MRSFMHGRAGSQYKVSVFIYASIEDNLCIS